MKLDNPRLVILLQLLTGEKVPSPEELETILESSGFIDALGHSQLNEVLLLSGLDRITQSFFAYLLTGEPNYKAGMAFESLDVLETGVERFRKMALISYGNVKFAFKVLSQDAQLLITNLEALEPCDIETFERRHDPLLPIKLTSPEEAYLTGYLIETALRDRLAKDSSNAEDIKLEQRRQEVVKQALVNQTAYLASDHLDVYVATSMRAKHEFIAISRTIRKIFEDPEVANLKLRWFDPTQAYCANRVDKGLAEALMLKRASCTIYLAQESDTLGKDSELASTLAQGKPVIAFIPDVTDEYFSDHLKALHDADPATTEEELLLEQLRLFEPEAAWNDATIRGWCEDPSTVHVKDLRKRLQGRIKRHYDSRASMLMDAHPLGIQVNLSSGVANGVLVVRSTQRCAKLVRGIVTRTLEFEISEEKHYTALRESISNSIFRVMTRDNMLTNTFWNFYLNQSE